MEASVGITQGLLLRISTYYCQKFPPQTQTHTQACGGGGGGGGGCGGGGSGGGRGGGASEFVEVCIYKNGHNSDQTTIGPQT